MSAGEHGRSSGSGARRVVVVGAGQAGVTLATELRRRGHAGPVTVVGAEPAEPYERPPLSKAWLAGQVGDEHLRLVPDPRALPDAGVELRTGDPVVGVDRDDRVVTTVSGRDLPYDELVLAVGARPRRLGVPGEDLPGVLSLRTLADARQLRARLAGARRLVVVGAGFVGMEVAAVAASAGVGATVLEALDRPHARLVGPEVSAAVARAHAAAGTALHTGAVVTELAGDADGVREVVTTDGRRWPADLVVVGIGVTPRLEVAEAAGLAVDAGPRGGVVVDELLRTADPRVSAVGDCAAFPSPWLGGRRVRVESVQNAADQAVAVAARLTGRPAPFTAVPWFWSDQLDLHLQIAGLPDPADERVVLGDPAGGSFSVARFRGGVLAAVESVSRPADHLAARKLLAAGARVDRATASAPGFDLKAHLAAVRRRPARAS